MQGDDDIKSLLSEEGYGRLNGQILQNALCIDFPHPARQYLELVAANLDGALVSPHIIPSSKLFVRFRLS